jgi:hypothetical protein
MDSFASATDASQRRLTIVARRTVSLARIMQGEELLCEVFDKALDVSRFLLANVEDWMEPVPDEN